jgi:hypothetical protein
MKFVPWAHWTQPCELSTGADNSAGRSHITLNEQPHGERRRMPTAGRQAMKEGSARRFFIKMEGLRVELSSKRFDPISINAYAS